MTIGHADGVRSKAFAGWPIQRPAQCSCEHDVFLIEMTAGDWNGHVIADIQCTQGLYEQYGYGEVADAVSLRLTAESRMQSFRWIYDAVLDGTTVRSFSDADWSRLTNAGYRGAWCGCSEYMRRGSSNRRLRDVSE